MTSFSKLLSIPRIFVSIVGTHTKKCPYSRLNSISWSQYNIIMSTYLFLFFKLHGDKIGSSKRSAMIFFFFIHFSRRKKIFQLNMTKNNASREEIVRCKWRKNNREQIGFFFFKDFKRTIYCFFSFHFRGKRWEFIGTN